MKHSLNGKKIYLLGDDNMDDSTDGADGGGVHDDLGQHHLHRTLLSI